MSQPHFLHVFQSFWVMAGFLGVMFLIYTFIPALIRHYPDIAGQVELLFLVDDTINDTVTGGQISGQMGGQIALSERQLEVLQIIKDNPTVTRKMLAEKLGINESAVQKHLEALKQNGIIKHVGKTRGHWEILPRL